MIVNGKQIADRILAEVATGAAALPTPPRLSIFTCNPNFETKKFLELKKRRAADAGVSLQLVEFDNEVTLPEVLISVEKVHPHTDGVIIQLPFSDRLPMEEVFTVILPSRDVDVFTYDGSLDGPLPPVVGSIDEIAKHHNVSFAGKDVVVLGRGRLVGIPAALYAKSAGAGSVTVLQKSDPGQRDALRSADIIIAGAGAPHIITPDLVKEGVVVFDAGTSESAGVLVGDVHPDVATKAALFTPVPGGIGPITVAVLFKNVLTLARQHRK